MLDKDFNSRIFESEEEPVFITERGEKTANRLSQEALDMLPDDIDLGELRKRLSDYFFSKLNNNYSKLEACCDIKRNTFQKVLSYSNARNVTYMFLAKFCVGAGLTLEEAEELFCLMGHALTDKNRVDAILRNELITHQDLEEFNKDLMKHCACYREKGIISVEE